MSYTGLDSDDEGVQWMSFTTNSTNVRIEKKGYYVNPIDTTSSSSSSSSSSLNLQPVTMTERDKSRYTEGSVNIWRSVGPKKYLLSGEKDLLENIKNFEVREDDVWIGGFCRSGTHWLAEKTWLICNNLDYEKALSVPHEERVLYYDFNLRVFENNANFAEMKYIGHTTVFGGLPSPRFFKTHLPLSLLASNLLNKTKMVYVVRDPRDVVVSCYYFYKNLRVTQFKKNLREFWDLFRNDLCAYCPYFENIKEYWAQREHPNLLFLSYEEMHKSYAVINLAASRKCAGLTMSESLRGVLRLHYPAHLVITPLSSPPLHSPHHQPILLSIRYSILTQVTVIVLDLHATIRKVAKFFGKSYTEEQFHTLYEHLQFSNMKENKAVNFDEMLGDRPNEVVRKDSEIQKLEPEVLQRLTEAYGNQRRKRYLLTGDKKLLENLRNFEIREDDVWIGGFSRSGTHWLAEQTWLICNNLDYEKALSVPHEERVLYYDFNPKVFENTTNYADLKYKGHTAAFGGLPSPRFFKTHLPLSVLAPNLLDKTKMIYVVRDPRDVVVSCYYFYKKLSVTRFRKDLREFWDLFRNDL
ncbi:Sulfotransferase 4A1, partial [Eumeta japonica]